jgi:hypothetical protein
VAVHHQLRDLELSKEDVTLAGRPSFMAGMANIIINASLTALNIPLG